MSRILVIDDEELIRMMVVQALEFEGHTVVEAVDGRDGIDRFRETAADLVITDMLMPNMEGIETIKALREIDPNVKIVAMSGGGRMKNIDILQMAHNLGADEIMKKPFEIDQLCSMVTNCLGATT